MTATASTCTNDTDDRVAYWEKLGGQICALQGDSHGDERRCIAGSTIAELLEQLRIANQRIHELEYVVLARSLHP